MKIAYVTTYNVLDKSTWPKSQLGFCGASYNISQVLANQSMILDYIGPLKKNFSGVTKAKWSFYRYFLKKDYYRWAEPLVLKDYADQIYKQLSYLNSDIVLCPENPLLLAYLECEQPIVLWTDSTLGGLINFYPYLSNLCNETKRNIYALEKLGLNKCQLVILTSDWAAQTAVNIFGINPSKIKVVPRGANIKCDRTDKDIRNLVESRPSSPCRLLFLGVEWYRKGGNVALEIAKQLNQIGLNTQLTVVGCKPPINEDMPNFVNVRGFIDKSTKEGLNEMNKIMAESHFLILPTVADCAPIVLIEANSFGVPCLATNIGGIKTTIKDNINGKTFLIEANILEYCNYILYVMEDYKRYKELAISAFNEYQYRLNWDVASKTAKQLFMNLI